jgi:hypothetical protein
MRPVIDHVPFAVRDLDAGIARFEAVGLAPTTGGEHPEAGTEMALVSLPDGSYLEILAPTASPPRWWAPFFERADPFAGPCGWCVETGSVHGECQRLIEHDVEVHGPRRGTRSKPDGTVVEWDWAFLGPRDTTLLPFLIADRTPRDRRVPESQLYGSAISGLERIVLLVDDIASEVSRFQRLYRFPEPETDYDDRFGDLAWFPGQSVILAEPTDGSLRDRLETFGPCPASAFLAGDIDDATHQFPLTDGREWFGHRLRFLEGLDPWLGIVARD